jgi:hypothetical protein
MHNILKEAHEARTDKLADLWACAHEMSFYNEVENLKFALASLVNVIANRDYGYDFIKDMTALANSAIAERVVEQRKVAS